MITVTIDGGDAHSVRRQMAELLSGGAAANVVSDRETTKTTAVVQEASSETGDANVKTEGGSSIFGGPTAGVATTAETDKTAAREVGQPAPGKARRTKAEIAEDEAVLAAAAKKPAISTGGERVDTADTAAKDEVDEAADKGAKAGELTHDDVRTALGEYVDKFGIEHAQVDGPKVFEMLFGEGLSKVSQIPNTQDALGKSIAGLKELLAKNPFKRTTVTAV